jgi:3-keto-L-gulonate-6-phosphate decarboxylase
MTEPNQAHDLLATLRDALHQLDGTLGLTREGVDAIVSQVERLHANVEALCDLRQREATAVGIDMLVDAAADFLAAFRALESGLPDAQAEVDTLEAELEDDAGREA